MQSKLLTIITVLAMLLIACNATEQADGQAKSQQGEAPGFKSDGIPELDSMVIDEEEARSLADGYVAHLESTHDPEATKAVWIDRDVVTAFARALEENTNLDGIRIYFGKYGEDREYPERSNKLTVFLIATRDSLGYHRDTFLFEKNSKKAAVELVNTNHGELCPNKCDGSFYYDENWK